MSPNLPDTPSPDFADDLDRANHALLLASGYHWFARNVDTHLPGSKTLYEKRCRDREAADDFADRCCLHLYRYDMRAYRPDFMDPVSYQAQVYLETPEGISVLVDLYGFGAGRLAELLPTLERLMLALWEQYSRKSAA